MTMTNPSLHEGNEVYANIRSVIMEFIDYGYGNICPISKLPTEDEQAEINAEYDGRDQLVAFLVAPNERTWDALVDVVEGGA